MGKRILHDSLFIFFFLFLRFIQCKVFPMLCHQFVMAAALEQASVVQNVDHIRISDGRETMCNDDCRAVFRKLIECLLYFLLRLGIKSRCRFIENDDRRILEEDASDGDARRAASSISSLVAFSRPYAIFSAMVSPKRKTSCCTIPIFLRRSCWRNAESGCPSSMTSPFVGS